MARSFTTTDRVDTAAIARPSALSILAWVRAPVTAAEAVVWSHSSSSGTRIGFQTNGDLVYRRSHATVDGVWTIASADITAVVPNRNVWFSIAIRHDGSNNANNATCWINGTAVTVTRTTAPSGAVATSSSGNPRWGNNAAATNPVGELGPVAYHSASLSDAAVTAWRSNPSTPQTACEVSYLMDSSSPATDLSANARAGTVTGTTVVSGPSFTTPVVAQVTASSSVTVAVGRRRALLVVTGPWTSTVAATPGRRRTVLAAVSWASTVTVAAGRQNRQVIAQVQATSTCTAAAVRRRSVVAQVDAASSCTVAVGRRRGVVAVSSWALGVAATPTYPITTVPTIAIGRYP